MLPSDVAAEVIANPPSSSEEVEGILQRLLSLLSAIDHPETELNPSLIWRCLNGKLEEPNPPGGPLHEAEWIAGLCLAGSLLMPSNEHVPSPFEIHALATQSIVFSEVESFCETYLNTCLVLCCIALWRCPTRVTSRPKRWRSILFETIRLCQQNLEFVEINVVVNHVLPACMHVRKALPEGAEPIGWPACFQSSIVHMLSFFAGRTVQEPDNQIRVDTITSLCTAAELATDGSFETILHARYYVEKEPRSKPSSYAKFLRLWMTGLVEEDDLEALASVDSKVDDSGLSILSYFWLEWPGRSQVYTHAHLWHLLFPGVASLLNSDDIVECRLAGFLLLQRLLSMIANNSLTAPSSQRPDFPVGTFQLLLNHVVADAAASASSGQSTSNRLPSSMQTFQMIKELLSKYSPAEQIRFVEWLHTDCPHPALNPKICDLLRGMVTWHDRHALKMAWSFLDSRLQSLEAHVRDGDGDEEEWHAVDVDDLVVVAEDYVAVMGIIRLWSMVRKTAPGLTNLPTRIERIVKAISRTIMMQTSDDTFRLGLLESASQLVLDCFENNVMEKG